ncbi:MAG TPA: hypothetical protein VFB78_02630 [Acidimicrobiales bacterium]|nr:hypothetical protein [Acidimicrobiales bacterium]
MRRQRHIDEAVTERLLSGTVTPDDAPPGLSGVAAALAAAAEPVPTAGPGAPLLAAMVSAIETPARPTPTPRRNPVLAKVLSTKVAITAAVLVLGVGSAAAATNNLPDAAQDGVSRAVSHVGIDLPRASDDNPSPHPDNHGADVSGVAHGDDKGAEHGAAVCAVASGGRCQPDHDTTSTSAPDDHGQGGEHGAAVCAVASDGRCQPDHDTTSTTAGGDGAGPGHSNDDHGNGNSNGHGKGNSDGHGGEESGPGGGE